MARFAHRAGALTAVALSLAIALSLAFAATAMAASPSPSGAIGGDPRSPGQGPGLMGDPAFAILAVVAIGLIATLGTLAWVKLTGGGRRS